MTSPELWREFSHDPRDPAYAPMRASDADRDVVTRALGEAYAQGRLTADEFDERSSEVQAARALGDLPRFLSDLVPAAASSGGAVPALSTADVEAQAVARWRSQRNDAVRMWLFVSTICWTIWVLTGFGEHPWPIYPMIGTVLPALGTLANRSGMIEQNRQKIVAKHEKAVAKAERKARELEARRDDQPPA